MPHFSGVVTEEWPTMTTEAPWRTLSLRRERPVVLAAVLLLVGDLLIIAVHGIAAVQDRVDHLYYVDSDRGYGELFQYLKYAWLLVLLGIYAVEQRSWRVATWLPLFTYFLLDDALAVHERAGEWVAQRWSLAPVLGLRAVDLGELLVSAAAGLLVLLPVALAFVGSTPPTRQIFYGLGLLVAVLLSFGIVLDMVHIIVVDEPRIGDPVGLIEDGGEMLALSMLVVFVYGLNAVRAGQSKGLSGLSTHS